MENDHHYILQVKWTGNSGAGTRDYKSYERSLTISAEGKPTLQGSADPAFRGDVHAWNPEELLLGALSSCHMLSYLHLCAIAGIVVRSYSDDAQGTMSLTGGVGKFIKATLSPTIVISDANAIELARDLHEKAHKACFIANSINFKVECKPLIKAG